MSRKPSKPRDKTVAIPNEDSTLLCHYGCGQVARFLFSSKRTPQCDTHYAKCPALKKQAKDKERQTLLERYGTFDPRKIVREHGKEIQEQRERFKRAVAGTLEIPEGQTCEYGCGKPAIQFILRTELWCCSTHPRGCPVVNEIATEKVQVTSREKYGTDFPTQSQSVRDKFESTCLERLGSRTPLGSPQVRVKIRETNLQRHGNIGGMGEETLAKRSSTLQERYGVNNVFQLEDVKEKSRETCRERFGEDYWMQTQEGRELLSDRLSSEEVQAKRKATCMKRYGVPHHMSEEAWKNYRSTCLKHFGFTHHFKSVKWFNSHMYQRKDYKLPSGKVVQVQGFEPLGLDRLFSLGIQEQDILLGDRVPSVSYTGSDGKSHQYHMDIFLRKSNKVIEIKSEYTFKRHEEINLLKRQACFDRGFEFEFWIYSNDGSSFRVL